jgi:hypothetical protein
MSLDEQQHTAPPAPGPSPEAVPVVVGMNVEELGGGSPGPSSAAPPIDPLTAWCIQHRFVQLEPRLRTAGVSDLGDLKYVTDEMLQQMGLAEPVPRQRFFVEANRAEPAAVSPPAVGSPPANAPSPILPPVPPPTPPPVVKSDSALAREMQDAEIAREENLKQIEERNAARSFDCPVCLVAKPSDGSFTGCCEHRVCGDCIYEYVRTKIEADPPETSEEQLRCVLCTVSLTANQVLAVLETYGRTDLMHAFLDDRLAASTRTGPFCSCPRCSMVHARSDDEATSPGERATCNSCEHPFCSRCAEPRYHYFHAAERDPPDCAGLMRQKRAAWLEWRASGQAAHVERLAQVAEHACD